MTVSAQRTVQRGKTKEHIGRRLRLSRRSSVRGDPLPKDLLQDPAVAHVVDVHRIVDAREAGERRPLPVRGDRLDLYLRPRRELVEPADRECSLTGQPEGPRALAG